MKLSFKYGTVNVVVDLPGQINIVRGDSGTGKSFVGKVLSQYKTKGLNIQYVNFSSYNLLSAEFIEKLSSNYLIVLDNADLYMNKSLAAAIVKSSAVFIIYTRSLEYFNRDNSNLCFVEYGNGKLCIRGERIEDYI